MVTMRPDLLFPRSWATTDGIHSQPEILEWVAQRNSAISVDITKTTLAQTGWFYDEATGQIVNPARTFFQISGFQTDEVCQPMLIQDEIGFLGIIAKPIDGVLHLLMQAKIEPGNVNRVQLSPTIQATKSNFTQQHGGARPAYLDYFLNAAPEATAVDQIQSEQSSRFLGKRNRNIVVCLPEEEVIDEGPNHRWLTLGQVKQLLKVDNLVNMDTRTVLSCLPFHLYDAGLATLDSPHDPALVRSITHPGPNQLPLIFRHVNDYKMFRANPGWLVSLLGLEGWTMRSSAGAEEFVRDRPHPFKVVFCDISIEGREVTRWGQPLFEAVGMAHFGLFTAVLDGVRHFLVRATPELGAFDSIELGPTVQLEPTQEPADEIGRAFFEHLADRRGVLYDVVLSEEGGRFYHEQNHNTIIEIDAAEAGDLPPGYFWLTYRTLSQLVQVNNCLNIQLRNLLSLMEI